MTSTTTQPPQSRATNPTGHRPRTDADVRALRRADTARQSGGLPQGRSPYALLSSLKEIGTRDGRTPALMQTLEPLMHPIPDADWRRGRPFRSCEPGRRDALQDRAMSRPGALKMIKRRARKAGRPAEICTHSFRGTGITESLCNDGDLEVAARIAGHVSTRTTQLYNRLHEESSFDEIERARPGKGAIHRPASPSLSPPRRCRPSRRERPFATRSGNAPLCRVRP